MDKNQEFIKLINILDTLPSTIVGNGKHVYAMNDVLTAVQDRKIEVTNYNFEISIPEIHPTDMKRMMVLDGMSEEEVESVRLRQAMRSLSFEFEGNLEPCF